ncbi:hypothetical protein HG421_17830 [Xanthomonas campestris pv. badrii]|uniref:Uncharacterized protein n=1 Tax=Xanthomonas campestris pv. badrii TaxID=149696 RepID=A0A7Z2ZJ92_XANCA|nr:hypothetical protein [Xanthomonas campestris]QJD69375.1 hypothetical protein HG421_17830 [Xanthomonas campestris pv. badrii]
MLKVLDEVIDFPHPPFGHLPPQAGEGSTANVRVLLSRCSDVIEARAHAVFLPCYDRRWMLDGAG